MEISATLAQQIVSDMKNIINQELNFMNTTGYVIASTDPKRINTEHEAAKIVCATRNEIVIESDQQYKGTKKGINIPVYFENNIIGVIGITGEKDEVSKFGQIIKKMTEILIKEAWLKDLSIQRRENNRRIIEFLLFTPESEKKQLNITHLFDFNMSSSSKIVIVAKITQKKGNSSLQFVDGLNTILDKYFSYNQQQVFTIKNDEIIIVMDQMQDEEIEKLLQSIKKEVLNKLQLALIFGIGSPTGADVTIKTSYQQASTTVRWYKSFSEGCIHYFRDMDIGLFLNHVSDTDKENFLHKVLSRLTKKEVNEYLQILHVYGKYNGSINKCSEHLFIHKNTLQYKLNKLAKLTGYNPRDLDDYVILKLAFLLYELG